MHSHETQGTRHRQVNELDARPMSGVWLVCPRSHPEQAASPLRRTRAWTIRTIEFTAFTFPVIAASHRVSCSASSLVFSRSRRPETAVAVWSLSALATTLYAVPRLV